ncbi:hypothetical protein D3C78_1782820 [compost metagenome]
METYFHIQVIFKFIIPTIIFIFVAMLISYFLVKSKLKEMIMKRLGYEYKRGLGNRVAYEFQPHWIKENIKINCRVIESLRLSKVKGYVKNLEKSS